MPQPGSWNDDELAAFEAGLTAENLTAIMRSTWTWDDRALRRDLARLLTLLRAVGELEPGSDVHRLVRSRALHSASGFLAAVLGPRVVADSGHATSYSFSETLVRSPWLVGGRDEERLLESVGATLPEDGRGAAGLDLAASPGFASRGLAAHALAASGDQVAGAELLSKIEAGALSATLAAAEASGSWDPALVRTRATPTGPQWLLEGEKYFVPHADTADVLLVVARSTAGPSLFAVEAAAAGLTLSTMPTIDPTRPLSRVRLSGVPAVLLGTEGAGGRSMARTLDLATTWLAEEQVRGTRRCLELAAAALATVDGVSGDAMRRYAELRVRAEIADALWQHARRLADDPADGGVAAAMAHIACSETFTAVAGATLQLVGGVRDAVVDEVARFHLRAQSSDLLFGGPALYYERLLERMDI
jgi:alkylation response protein AidB-like acyl-CoA dehydrogenase